MQMEQLLGVFLVAFVSLSVIEAVKSDSSAQDKSQDEDGDTFINSWAVKIPGGAATAEIVALRNGFTNLGLVPGIPDVYHFQLSGRSVSPNIPYISTLASDKLVEFAQQQVRSRRVTKYYDIPQDPCFKEQWNLVNREDMKHDLRVEPAWLQGLTGCGITVAVVDEGIDFRHPDLWPNFVPSASKVISENGCISAFEHGTRVSGVVGAAQDETCGVGVAHQCNLISVGLLQKNGESRTDMEEEEALLHSLDIVDVYSNSWGPADGGRTVKGPGNLVKQAFEMGVNDGRNGNGVIYVWASGNGGNYDDDCGTDGYVSSIYTIAVGAIGVDGRPSSIDERCSGKMVVAYVTDQSGKDATTTTDPNAKCTHDFGKTSAAAALVSGAIALALEANQNLTWRDVQYLIVYTANPNLTDGTGVKINGAGLAVSRQFGFGVMDTEAMVTRARHWINVPPQMNDSITSISHQNETGGETYSAIVTYTGPIQYLEHVVVRLSVAIPENPYNINRGNLSIELTSPNGTLSVLLQPRPEDKEPGKYEDWDFMSVMFWGENPTGRWTLSITCNKTGVAIIDSGVEFKFYGVSEIPEAVANIPDQCDPDCSRGCAREGSDFCDSCLNLRNAHTLECIDDCPSGYTERSGYCYDASLPTKQCNSPLKNKENFTAGAPCCRDSSGRISCCSMVNVTECESCKQVCVETNSTSPYCVCGVSYPDNKPVEPTSTGDTTSTHSSSSGVENNIMKSLLIMHLVALWEQAM